MYLFVMYVCIIIYSPQNMGTFSWLINMKLFMIVNTTQSHFGTINVVYTHTYICNTLTVHYNQLKLNTIYVQQKIKSFQYNGLKSNTIYVQ